MKIIDISAIDFCVHKTIGRGRLSPNKLGKLQK